MTEDEIKSTGTTARFISEAKRRHLFRAAGLYAGGAFVLLQLADILLPGMGLPEDTINYLLMGIAAGFPAMLVIVWLLDLSGDREDAPGRLIDAVIVVLALGVGVLYLERLTEADEQPAILADEVLATPQAELRDVLHNSIAVLPFDNLSPNPDDAYFAAGIHEEVLNQLVKVRDLSVIARTTMLRYTGSNLSVPDIGKELMVRTVMEGSVRYAGNRVRITAQLIDVETGAHLWSEAYEEELLNIFDIQLDIARRIARSMKAELTLSEEQRIGRQATDNPEAYAQYLLALSRWGNLAATAPIHQALDAAIALDPEFAPALAFKAWIYGVEGAFGFFFTGPDFNKADQDRFNRLAETFAQRTLAVDSQQALAHAAMGYAFTARQNYDSSIFYNEAAYALDPGNYLAVSQGMAARMLQQDYEAAAELMDKVVLLNPSDVASAWNVAGLFYNMAMYKRARSYAERVTRLLPDSAMGYAVLAVVLSRMNESQLAIEAANATEARDPSLFDYSLIALAYNNLGDMAEARRIFELTPAGDEETVPHLGWHANMYLAIGDHEKMLDYLERSIETGFPTGNAVTLRSFPYHPDFAPVHDHPRYQELLRRVGAID